MQSYMTDKISRIDFTISINHKSLANVHNESQLADCTPIYMHSSRTSSMQNYDTSLERGAVKFNVSINVVKYTTMSPLCESQVLHIHLRINHIP